MLFAIVALFWPSSWLAYNAIIVCGSSGMGKAAARIILEKGGDVMLVSRTLAKLEAARLELAADLMDMDMHCSSSSKHSSRNFQQAIDIRVLDATDEAAVQRFAQQLDDDDDSDDDSSKKNKKKWDGLVISSAGRAPHGPMLDLDTEATRDMMETKVIWTAYLCAKYNISTRLQDGGAVVLVAGILNRRTAGLENCVPLAMANEWGAGGLDACVPWRWNGDRGCASIVFCPVFVIRSDLIIWIRNEKHK